jgi:oligopeptide/dipeptide ABC transporter ATP-binding protein
MNGKAPVLEVDDLSVEFITRRGILRAVEGVSLRVDRGEILGVVGESGSGKSVTARAVLGIVPSNGTVTSKGIRLSGEELSGRSQEWMRRLRAQRIGLVPQNPMTALDPVLRVGYQMAELMPRSLSRKDRETQLSDALARVGLPDPVGALNRYPHEFSGGGRQRILIAMAILSKVELLIADEPTTALDVTIQAQILSLLRGLTDELGMSTLLITHNMGVVAAVCDRMAVMYAGEKVEDGAVATVLARPEHPYTAALLRAAPSHEAIGKALVAIPGTLPDMVNPPPGCRFRARCAFAAPGCEKHPDLEVIAADHALRCWRPWSSTPEAKVGKAR